MSGIEDITGFVSLFNTVPQLVLVLIYVFVSGNLVRLAYSWRTNDEFLKNTKIRFGDVIVLMAGIIIIYFTLYSYNQYSIDVETLKVFLTLNAFLRILLFTGLSCLIAYNINLNGQKWITDKTKKLFTILFLVFLIVIFVNALRLLIDFAPFSACYPDFWCILNVIPGKLLYLGLVLITVKPILLFLKELIKTNRYRANTKSKS